MFFSCFFLSAKKNSVNQNQFRSFTFLRERNLNHHFGIVWVRLAGTIYGIFESKTSAAVAILLSFLVCCFFWVGRALYMIVYMIVYM